ncbi:MAG: MerR family transcriptional regulator [Ardenticatenaceae bacterium]
MAELDLFHYSTAPLFNTKAVVQETGISASTLRAWERRYGLPAPTRTKKNYRLYSEYDIGLIRWLHDQIDSGLSISQAVELYHHMKLGEDTPANLDEPQRVKEAKHSYDAPSCQTRLIKAFKAFDEEGADQLIGELFVLFPIEHVLTEIIDPVMVEVGEQWHAGELPIPVEHFASAYIKRKIMSLMNAQPNHPHAPIVITGCAPHEQHELGILFLSLFLQRNGLRVIYLGQNVPQEDLRAALEALQPAMIALSAMTEQTALKLQAISKMITELPTGPIFAFGGSAFNRNPELGETLSGIRLGNDAVNAARLAVKHIRRHQNQKVVLNGSAPATH